MKEIWKNKKIRIGILVLCILILIGVIIGIALNGDRNETGKEDDGQDVIVYEADKNTVEKKDEGGLTESDSEDGPVLNEDNMIDFNGSDAKTEDNETDDGKTDKGSVGNKNNNNENSSDDDSTEGENSGDTGTWGTFY